MFFYWQVLCIIQAYCTSSTIATLHDLERYICDVEGKNSFSELKLGPLQKFPLVYHYFRFPHDEQIHNVTIADIIKYLWEYGKTNRKRIDLPEFLEHIAKKRNFKNPYEVGVLINSIALAISVGVYIIFNGRFIAYIKDYNACFLFRLFLCLVIALTYKFNQWLILNGSDHFAIATH